MPMSEDLDLPRRKENQTQDGATQGRSCGSTQVPFSTKAALWATSLVVCCRLRLALWLLLLPGVSLRSVAASCSLLLAAVTQPRRPSAASRTTREEGPVSYTFVYFAVYESTLCSRDQYREERLLIPGNTK